MSRVDLIATAIVRAMQSLVRVYQVTVSPWLGPRCRFYPSCSHYAVEAWEEHGVARGSLMTVQRLLRCHPFHPGGYDPVHPAASRRALVPDGTPERNVIS